jgi:hypothetical protein
MSRVSAMARLTGCGPTRPGAGVFPAAPRVRPVAPDPPSGCAGPSGSRPCRRTSPRAIRARPGLRLPRSASHMIDTPRMPASICSRFARGSERSFSQARIVLTFTPSRLASSAWLRPEASRAPVIRSPKVVASASYQPGASVGSSGRSSSVERMTVSFMSSSLRGADGGARAPLRPSLLDRGRGRTLSMGPCQVNAVPCKRRALDGADKPIPRICRFGTRAGATRCPSFPTRSRV